jgi:integrase
MDITPDFKKARLVKSKKEDWYILFYVWDAQKQKLIRKRKFIPKDLKNDEAKVAFAKDYIKKVDNLLEHGYHIDRRNKKPEPSKSVQQAELTYKEALEKYINYSKNVSKNSLQEVRNKYHRAMNFLRWAEENNYRIIMLHDVTEKYAQQYFDYLIETKGVSPKTHNNILGRLRVFYNTAVKRKWTLEANPFNAVDTQKCSYGEKNIAYSEKQLNTILPYVKETDPYLYKFICFIYYAMMRPSEIKRLKVRNIDLEKNQIRIESKMSKTKKFDILPIADGLRNIIVDMRLEECNDDDYLFTAEEKPSPNPMGRTWSTDHFKKVKEHFNLNTNYSIYGFKHTAVCRWYDKEKDIVRIQKMCRHSTIEMTARYLKSLGLLTDVYKIETLPEII